MKALKHKVKSDQKTEAANLSKQAARVQPSRFLSSFQPWPVRMTNMDIEDWLNSPKRACLVLDEEFIIQLFRPVVQSAILGQKPTPTVPIYSSSAHALDFLTPIKTFSKSDLTKHRNSEEERRSSRFNLKIGSPALAALAKHRNHFLLFSLWHDHPRCRQQKPTPNCLTYRERGCHKLELAVSLGPTRCLSVF